MPAYMVRTFKGKQLVGVFFEKSELELVLVVDEKACVLDCEYLELKSGEGLFVDAQFVPTDDINTPRGSPMFQLQTADASKEMASLSERLAARVLDGAPWTPFTTDLARKAFLLPKKGSSNFALRRLLA